MFILDIAIYLYKSFLGSSVVVVAAFTAVVVVVVVVLCSWWKNRESVSIMASAQAVTTRDRHIDTAVKAIPSGSKMLNAPQDFENLQHM